MAVHVFGCGCPSVRHAQKLCENARKVTDLRPIVMVLAWCDTLSYTVLP